MVKKKALLVATVQSHIAQFHRPLIKLLKENGYEVNIAARNNLGEKNGLQIKNVDVIYDIPFQRAPLHPLNLKAFLKIHRIIEKENYDIVSCNTPAAGVYTRIATIKARKKGTKVFYTAHGFHFYKGASKKNWLIFYPIERSLARITDTLITITKEDYRLAKRTFKTNVEHIYGVGADNGKFLAIGKNDIESLRQNEAYKNKFIILCTGELNKNKNQKALIYAMKEIVKKHPEAKLLLAGNGPLELELNELITENKLDDNVELLGYRTDVEKYVLLSDLVISVSLREGLPLNIVEASICKKAVVASYNRGHRELIIDHETGRLVDPHNIEEIANIVIELIEDPVQLNNLAKQSHKHLRRYWMDSVEKKLKRIYINQ